MRNYFSNIKSIRIYVGILFFVASVIIIYFFPNQGKFRYEYQKGTPWQHEDLIAPFDFAIYKTDVELKEERDSLLLSFNPYFVYDNEIGEAEMQKFNDAFAVRYEEAKKQAAIRFGLSKVPDSFNLKVYNYCKDVLNFIYEKGVVNFTDILDQTKAGSAIVVLKDNLANNREVEDVFTQKLAYSFINKKLVALSGENRLLASLVENMRIYDFIVQNLYYDQKTSDQVKDKLVNSISLTRGMVQAGERIISKGDLVHTENYRVLESLRREYQSVRGSNVGIYWILLGQSVIVIIAFVVLFLFLYNFRREILDSFRKSLFIVMLILIVLISTSLVVRYSNLSIYVVPFIAVTIIIHAFYDARLALFIFLVTIMLGGFLAPNGFEFIFLQFIAGAISIFSMAQLYRRGQLFYSVGLIILSYTITYTALAILQEGSFKIDNPYYYAYFAINGLLLLASYPLIFLFEKLFGFISDATLLELSDTNHPALRELAEKAPGTFQHVIQVANLAEEAVRKIGGNPLLMRVGALYHDIGKTGAPAFFVENQAGRSPHDGLTYEKSAEAIIQHVHYGVDLARKYKLPKIVTDFITTHHGTGLVKYFYTKSVNESSEKLVDVSKFSYPGPSPFTKETAVLMMADAVEASSRTLKEYNESSIDKLVETIINAQVDDSQFAEAEITFKDIFLVKEVFKQKLMNIYHARIEYPVIEH